MKLLKQGRYSRVWKDGSELVKEYLVSRSHSAAASFEAELSAVKRLQKVSSPQVVTPIILSVDKRRYLWRQPFIKSKPFYYFLAVYTLMRRGRARMLAAQLGSYLGRLHKKGIVHGDLSYHNIRFLEDKVFLFDPGCAPCTPIEELAKLLLNFEPFNPFGLLLPRKSRATLQQAILNAYEKEAGPVKREELRRCAVQRLRKDRVMKRSSLSYRCKKHLINLLSKRLESRILKGKALSV